MKVNIMKLPYKKLAKRVIVPQELLGQAKQRQWAKMAKTLENIATDTLSIAKEEKSLALALSSQFMLPAEYAEGSELYKEKKWAQALELFEKSANKQPEHAESHFKLGLCHMKLGHLAEAHSHIQTALKLAPHNTQWQTQLEQCKRKLEQAFHTAAHVSPAEVAKAVDLSALPPRILQGGASETIGVSIKKKLLLLPSDYNHRALADIMPFVTPYSDDFDVYIIVRETKQDIEKKRGYTLIKNGTSYGEFLKFTADYVIDAGSMNFGYRISDEPTWTSVWHGIPYKKMFVDMDIKNLAGAIRYGMAYDSMISMSDFYTDTFLRGAMRYDGVIHQLGCAKIDKLFQDDSNWLVLAKQKLGLDLQHRIIVYAPEFRSASAITLPFSAEKLLTHLGDAWSLLICLDPKNTLDGALDNPRVAVSNEIDVTQALLIGDVLLSDYHMAYIEMFSQFAKPVVLFQYDFNQFVWQRSARKEEVEALTSLPYAFTREQQLLSLDWNNLKAQPIIDTKPTIDKTTHRTAHKKGRKRSHHQTLAAEPKVMKRHFDIAPSQLDKNSALRMKLGIPMDKKVILFAPTFRERGEILLPFNPANLLEAVGDSYVIITKLHYLNTLKRQYHEIIDCTDYGEITDLMKIADVLISDYSSLVLDFALLNKPIILFQYDYFKYMNNRGVYFDFGEYLPAHQIIDREIDLYRLDWTSLTGDNQKIIDTFYPLEDGSSTKRIVETLAFKPEIRQTKDIIFLVNDLNQIGGVHSFIHNMAKYYKQKYNSRVYLLAIKEFAEMNSEFHVFDSPYVDFKLSSQMLGGGCANILQNTDGVVISLQFSAHMHFQKYLYNAKTVLMFHGDVKDMISGELYGPHLGWLNDGDIINYDKFLLLTKSNQDLLAGHLNKRVRMKLGYMHNSIDATYQPLPRANKNAVAAISRLDADKNIFALIDLGKELQRIGSDYVVNIYGDGELKTALQAEIEANDLLDCLKLHGFESDKVKIFSENNALLLLSKSEGLPLVALEAYAHGRPVIAFDSFTSAKEIIRHQKTGYLTAFEDFAAVAQHLTQLDEILESDIKALFHEYENEEVFAQWNALFGELDALHATK